MEDKLKEIEKIGKDKQWENTGDRNDQYYK